MTAIETRPETHNVVGRPAHDTPLLRQLRVEWAPLLTEIAAGTLQRELDGELPVDVVRRLKKVGFGAVRVPVEHGGRGATVATFDDLDPSRLDGRINGADVQSTGGDADAA